MAVSSVLRPESIVGRQPQRTPEQFQEFFSGGSSIGSSVIQSAANKIVGFQRAAVKPVVPDINSIISSISNSIVTNVDNSIRNATNITNQNTDKKIEVVKTEVNNLIEQIKTSAPILEIKEKINNLQTQLIEVEKAQQPEQIKEIVSVLQTQINELKQSDPVKKISPIIQQIQSQIETVSRNKEAEQIQTVVNRLQNDIIQVQNNIENIQNQTNSIQNTNEISEVRNIIKNVQERVNNIQTQVNTIQSQPASPPEQSVNPITQIQNVVQNIQTNVNQTLQQTIDKLTSDYRDKVKQVDDSKPSGILGKFLDVYKTAIGFVQFFGNKKNIDRLKSSLVALKESFAESFEVAKLIRQTIIKIVKQLSNLPKASPAGGAGLNIDLDIPGGPLRKSAPRGMNRRMGGRAGMLGLGLGGLALGTSAVNALQDSDMVQPLATSPEIPQNLVDRFSAIVDKFSAAVESLIKGSSQKKREQTASQSGGSAGGATPGEPSSSPGTAAMPSGAASDVTADTKEEKAWLQTIRKVEGTADKGGYGKLVGGEVVPELTQMTLQEVYDLGMKGNIGEGTLPQRLGGRKVKFGADSHAMGAYQFKPQTMMGVAKQLGLDPKTTLFSPEIQDKLGLANLRSSGVDPTKKADIQALNKAQKQWAGLGPYYGQTGRTLQQSQEIYNQFYQSQSQVSPQKGGMGGPSVDPSMLAMDTRTLTAQAISQPAKKAAPTVNVLPLNMPTQGASQQAAPKSTPAAVSTPSKPGQSIPIIPSSNPDNFLVVYSKMVYNIVDG